MAVPLGVFAFSAAASTEPLDNVPSFWKKPKALKLKRALSTQRRSSHESNAGSLFRSYRWTHSAKQPSESDSSSPAGSCASSHQSRSKHVPIVVPDYDLSVAPQSPCTSVGLSSSRSSTIDSSRHPSLSGFPSPNRGSIGDTSSLRSRHVEIVIPDWVLPTHRYSTSPVKLPFDSGRVKTPVLSYRPRSPIRMARQTPNTSRTNTIDSQTSAPSPSQLYPGGLRSGSGNYNSSVNSSQTSLHQQDGQDAGSERPPTSSARTPGLGMTPSPAMAQTAGLATPTSSTSGLSGLVCNVHRTTGREPHPLVGATTTILGDKLYVFGGRRLSRTRPQLTSDLYELDLVKRHWTKIETKGDIPPPRYFHSLCALGDTKLVCYGGMSPATSPANQSTQVLQGTPADAQPEVVVMSDVHIYDVATRTWRHVGTNDAPQGRYAHCATILPSSAVFSATGAAMTAIRHNPSSLNPNQGSIGINLEGDGGAEMVVVGGQDSANHYIEQISVFNLRSLKWTTTSTLGRSCGAYRSVVAPLTSMPANEIGAGARGEPRTTDEQAANPTGESSMLIYSNYNFLDVKLELQVRHPDGTLSEKPMNGNFSPPGLRFPNGGVINNHFVVSGTFLTSSKQEYALWALDLRTLSWGRIEAGGNIFSQGSWNRGVLWTRRNSFVILGNRKRSLVEDYNHRRINFSNMCVVELEAFGLYDNPRKVTPSSAFPSVSAPPQNDRLDLAGGRALSSSAIELGQIALGMRELADMDFLAIHGERIPVNSRLIARRWGPYFNQLLRESTHNAEKDNADAATLRPATGGHPSRMSSITITPSIRTTYSAATTLTANTTTPSELTAVSSTSYNSLSPPDPTTQPPSQRPRTLYLPHTHLTLQALIHYLYTSSLPPQSSQLCTPQILCSLLQLARPYHIDGLLEAIIERLHVLLDNRNTAAVFNAAAMAAGGGSGVAFMGVNNLSSTNGTNGLSSLNATDEPESSMAAGLRALRIDTAVPPSEDEVSSAVSEGTSASASDSGEYGSRTIEDREVWNGVVSAVVGLQKRGLRGLMEGRRIREMGRSGRERRDVSEGGINGDGVGLGLT
ncbi:uncharacterized protein EKO05_0004079 [Ascochyta rabiei]|uniref:Uncharacterized protein n=1 Tax=Didymella rabiei TaxID=5454 RepID=A0A162Y756_DIDRA|nr:uncharacterized protein EKO05_0004079 [Ascochyta rabiei]KZM19853.1 hypothetical protein ST47_g9237 [Ascochyta rabiei]UPX13577.1 hypothetical protein EKO05_0004079 [Ascochyta rabiei]